jgi:LuxR family transcriptional regulator of spore coat protein
MDQSRFDSLTSRQREALQLLAIPMRAKEAAVAMGLSPRTVEAHLAEAARRLGVGSSLEAARLYAEHSRAVPEKLPEEETLVGERPAPRVSVPPPAPVELAPTGRRITLDYWQRSAIIVGLTIGLVFSVFILIAGGETLARIVRSEHLTSHS